MQTFNFFKKNNVKAFICKISSYMECESNITKSSLWLMIAYLEDETTFAPQSALKCAIDLT